MNKIFIENYSLISKHGYYKEEHYKSQRFVLSIWCEVAENKSGNSDELNETFNYEEIRKVMQKVVLGEHKKLLETLAEQITEEILEFDIVKSVEVKISKPDIWGDCEPGIWIKRSKSTFTKGGQV